MKQVSTYPKGLDVLQKISVTLMAFLVLITFLGANLHALLWQKSSWLVSTVLPAVVVELTNEERESLNAPELRRNTTLDKAAQLKAQHMAQNEYFSHYSPDGVSPWHWFNEAGYVYAHAGENLAIHFTDSSEVVQAWMDSPTHRANIVNANYTEIGVGTAKGTYDGFDTVYVVQLFGAPAVVPVAVTESANATELAELANRINEVAEQINDLEVSEVAVVTEPPEVLAESTEETDVIESSELVIEPDINVAEEKTVTTARVDDVYSVTTTPEPREVLVVESMISTSSGLAVASITDQPVHQAGTTVVSMATQPNEVLEFVYLMLGMIVMTLLLSSAIFEARKLHFTQVAYSLGLMVSMGALWFVHSLLTSGAIIV